MPVLNDQELNEMRSASSFTCYACKHVLSKNYCRQCDEYFNGGHKDDCPVLKDPDSREDHRHHRTY